MRAVLGVAVVLAGLTVALILRASQSLDRRDWHRAQALERPRIAGAGYTSSSACRACHPAEYASWQASFHRTMTQAATPRNVIGRFDGTIEGTQFAAIRRGDRFFVMMPDRQNPAGPFRERPVVLLTGAHHMQLYWVPRQEGSEHGPLEAFPYAFLLPERRWIPNEHTLLRPPDADLTYAWGKVCFECHAVQGQNQGNATHVAELGIACEACHGPGEDHVLRNTNPAARWSGGAEKIVNPKKLSGRDGAEVCGQCHSIHLDRTRYVPGDTLVDRMTVVRSSSRTFGPAHEKSFWADGMVRVSGREYNGFIESPCAKDSDFSCTSCHSMHDSDPDDQLLRRQRNLDCEGCHDGLAANHSRHPESVLCVDCHMPHTTYGLLKAIRSHEIDSPSQRAKDRPNACNLCHLDKTLEWTASELSRLWGVESEPPSDTRVPAAVEWLLAGDAGQRALLAWHMSWPPALEASGGGWQAELLERLRDDPYPAVRIIAERSVRQLSKRNSSPEGPSLSSKVLDSLTARRDDRPVELAE